MEIPNWLTRFLDKKGLVQICEAVTKAEVHTSAEIVPMVVRSSIVTGHVAWLLFLLGIPIAWSVMPLMMHDIYGEALTVVVAFILAVGLRDIPLVQRWLTPNRDEAISVYRRAQLEFHLAGLKSTTGHTGVLIFVSILERRAVVLADSSIADKFDAHAWDDVLKKLLVQVKKGKFALGMTEAIEHLGQILQEKFPVASHDVNELPNTLIIKD